MRSGLSKVWGWYETPGKGGRLWQYLTLEEELEFLFFI
jgi:hypothetical protein